MLNIYSFWKVYFLINSIHPITLIYSYDADYKHLAWKDVWTW